MHFVDSSSSTPMPYKLPRSQRLRRVLEPLDDRRKQLSILSTLDEDDSVEVVSGPELGEDGEKRHDMGRESGRIKLGDCE